VDEEWGDHMAKVMVAVFGDKLYRPNAANDDDKADGEDDADADAAGAEDADEAAPAGGGGDDVPANDDDDDATGFGSDEMPSVNEGDDVPEPVVDAAPLHEDEESPAPDGGAEGPAAVASEAIIEELPSPAELQGKVRVRHWNHRCHCNMSHLSPDVPTDVPVLHSDSEEISTHAVICCD
jgi:hypothetical protein